MLSTTRHTGTVWRTPFVKLTEMPAALRLEQMLWKRFEFFSSLSVLKLGYVSSFWVTLNGSFFILWSDWGFIVKVYGDLGKTYLSSLEGTDEWNTEKMKIKLYCKVPNDIFITILLCLLKKMIIIPMIQYSLTNPYPFFWMDRERLEMSIFCFATTHMLPLDKMVSGDFSVWELGWS